MSKKTKGRLPRCVVTKHPKRKGGDKGTLEWTVISNGRSISKQSELYCNRQHMIHEMRQTVTALVFWLAENVDGITGYDDGTSPTDALSTPTPE